VVLFSVWKFRMRPGQEEMDGPPIHGNTRLEVVWTAVPAILIVSLCTYAYTVLRSNEANKTGAMTVNVTTRQFAFQFAYPEANGKQVVSSVLYLPVNQPVVFKLRSYDVIHSFFVPSFSEKIDSVPGIVTTLRVTPNALGTYPVECTELCGAGHSLMRTSVQVVSAPAFQHWLGAQSPNAPPPIPEHHLIVIGRVLEHERRRRQGGIHRGRRVQWLPHAGRRWRHRYRRAESRPEAQGRLRVAGVPERPRHHA